MKPRVRGTLAIPEDVALFEFLEPGDVTTEDGSIISDNAELEEVATIVTGGPNIIIDETVETKSPTKELSSDGCIFSDIIEEEQEVVEESVSDYKEFLCSIKGGGLSVFGKELLISVIDESINKLVIIGANKPQYSSITNFTDPLVRYKTVNIQHRLDELCVPKGRLREIKFQRDRELLVKMLSIIRQELKQNTDFQALYVFLSKTFEDISKTENILHTYSKNLAVRKELSETKVSVQEQVEQAKRGDESYFNLLDGSVCGLKKYMLLQLTYYYKWHKARYDQNKLMIELDKKSVQNNIVEIRHKIETEYRINSEIMNYLKIANEQLTADLNYWKEKCVTELAELANQVSTVENEIHANGKAFRAAKRRFNRRKVEMAQLKADTIKQMLARREEKRKIAAVLKIQSWWRGTMVRWELGRYGAMMKKRFKRLSKHKKDEKKKKRKN